MLWLAAVAIYSVLALRLPPTPFLLETSDQLAAHVVFALVSLLLLAPAAFNSEPSRVPARVLTNPVVAWLGLISYGIFLWHYVFALELGSPGQGWGFVPLLGVTLALTILCAAASYYLVERPFLRLKYRPLRAAAALRPRRVRRA